MIFNVGIKGKGYCFVDVDITIEEYLKDTAKVKEAIKEKYGLSGLIGFCPKDNLVGGKEE